MKTKKEHPAGNQVQDLNTFSGCEQLTGRENTANEITKSVANSARRKERG